MMTLKLPSKTGKKHTKRAKNKRFWLFFDRISNFGQHRCLGSTKKLSFFIYTYQNQSSLRNLDISTPCNLKTSPKVVGLSFLSI